MLSRLAVLALCLAFTSVAHAATVNGSVTMLGETGDYISSGQTNLFDLPGTLSISGGSRLVQVNTPTPFGGVFGYTMSFEAPEGSQLQVGEYDNAERWPFEPAGEAGLGISGDGRGCNEDFGRFTIKDIHLTAGVPDRFWATYEQHCESPHAPTLFGEVRVGEPVSVLPETVEPRAINWPNTSVGSTSTTVPVTVTAGGSGATISSDALQGTNAGDFHIVSDACSGTHLAASGTCIVSVRMAPTAASDRSAQLVITDSANNATAVDLGMRTQPDVTHISPAGGVAAGGTTVTLTGRNFTGATGVKFGSANAPSFTVDSPTQITATTPPGTAPSNVGVEVTSAHGHSWGYPYYMFRYAAPPDAPHDVTAQAGPNPGEATITFSPGGDGGSSITSYTVTASPGGVHASADSSRITVTGLDDVTTYTFTVTATNDVGDSSPSSASNAITTLRPTTTTAFAPPGSTIFGDPIDLTAAVGSTFSGTPTGSVLFTEDTFTLGSVPIGSDGHTTHPFSAVVDVDEAVDATYSGDLSFAKSTTSVHPTVTPAHTSTSLSVYQDPSTPDDTVIDAYVSNLDTFITPFGSVQFLIDDTPVLDSIPLDYSGTAEIFAELPAGTHQFEAQYFDDTAAIPDFVGSSGRLTQVITNTPPVTPRPPRKPPTRPSVTPDRPNTTFLVGSPGIKAGVVSLSVQSTDRGVFSYVARTVRKFATASRRATVVYARGNVLSKGNGTARTLRIRPNSRAKRLLAKKHRLRLRITLTFRSAKGGNPSHVVIPVTVTTQKQRHSRRRAR